MAGSDAKTEASDSLRDGREHDRRGNDAVVAELPREERRGDLVVEDDWDDGGLGEAGIVAEVLEAGAKVVAVGFEAGDTLRLFLEDCQAFGDGGDGGSCHGGGEDIRAARVLEEDSHFLGAGDETADGGDGLGEGTGPEIDFAGVDAEVLIGAATGGAEDAGGVSLVDEEEAAELFLDGNEIGEA